MNKVLITALVVLLSITASLLLERRDLVRENSRVNLNYKAACDTTSYYKDKSNNLYAEKRALILNEAEIKASNIKEIQSLKKTIKDQRIALKNVNSGTVIEEVIKEVLVPVKLNDSTYVYDKGETKIEFLQRVDSSRFNVNITNKQTVLIHNERETVKPPKKYWILRLFQKKHDVVFVSVVNSNQDIKTDNIVHVQVLK